MITGLRRQAIMARLASYWRFGSSVLAYTLLAILWAEGFAQFVRNMAPRLSHLSAAGMRIGDWPCGVPQCDFSVFWPAGLLARAGQLHALYAPSLLQAWRARLFTPQIEPLAWYYPPPALLLVTPVSWLPFEAGFYVWLLALAAAAAALLRAARLPWAVIAAVLLCPSALWDWQLGQLGVLTGALLVCGLLSAARAPTLGGIVLGLLVIKPQAGFLAPAALLGGRHWRAIWVAVLVVALLLAATTSLFRFGVWRDFLGAGLAASHAVLLNPDLSGSQKFGISVFWALRAAGAAPGPAMALQAAAALLAMAACYLVWRAAALSPFERLAITAGLALLATPYGYTDDMVAFSAGLAALAWRRRRIDLLDVLCWTWPTLSPVVFMRTGMLLTPLVVAISAGRIWLGARAPVLPAGKAVLPGG
jgi:hypothetical protein